MNRTERLAWANAELKKRILVLDGSWGVFLQGRDLKEEDFRGQRFSGHNRPLKGDFDVLCLTRPDIVRDVHDAYIGVGVDITSTNTFNATAISQGDYALQALAQVEEEAAKKDFGLLGELRAKAGVNGTAIAVPELPHGADDMGTLVTIADVLAAS